MSMVIISGKTKIYGKTIFDTTPPVVYPEYNLWNFASINGAILNNLNITHDTNITVNWNDGSGDQNIDSGINYNHTFN